MGKGFEMLTTYGCEAIPATLADTVPKGLGVTQVIPHIQQLNPCLPLLTQASLEQTHSDLMVGATFAGRQI